MTVGELKEARRAGESFVVTVEKHETADMHGPAPVVLVETHVHQLRDHF